MTKIQFRPHHFLCTLGFQGKGYSPNFVRNYKHIHKTLTDSPNTTIHIVDKTDSICSQCPFKQDSLCQNQTKIQALDKKHQKMLDLKIGSKISWAQAKQVIKEKATLEGFHQACSLCEWKKYGFCEKALKDLKNQ